MADYLETFGGDEDMEENPFAPKSDRQMMQEEAQARAMQKASMKKLKEKKGESAGTAGGIIGAILGTIAAAKTGKPMLIKEGFQKGKKIGTAFGTQDPEDFMEAGEELINIGGLMPEDEEEDLLTSVGTKKAGMLEGSESIGSILKTMA
jgi:hypothetical protein